MAHEWAQKLPLSDKRLSCIRCNTETNIGAWDIPRCIPHKEAITSGYLPEQYQ